MASAASIMAAEAVPTVVAEAMALPADAAGQAHTNTVTGTNTTAQQQNSG